MSRPRGTPDCRRRGTSGPILRAIALCFALADHSSSAHAQASRPRVTDEAPAARRPAVPATERPAVPAATRPTTRPTTGPAAAGASEAHPEAVLQFLGAKVNENPADPSLPTRLAAA